MKGTYGFLSGSLACLASALVIVSVLAMPTQGIRANDSSSGGEASPTDDSCVCNELCFFDEGFFNCIGQFPTCYNATCVGFDCACPQSIHP